MKMRKRGGGLRFHCSLTLKSNKLVAVKLNVSQKWGEMKKCKENGIQKENKVTNGKVKWVSIFSKGNEMTLIVSHKKKNKEKGVWKKMLSNF